MSRDAPHAASAAHDQHPHKEAHHPQQVSLLPRRGYGGAGTMGVQAVHSAALPHTPMATALGTILRDIMFRTQEASDQFPIEGVAIHDLKCRNKL